MIFGFKTSWQPSSQLLGSCCWLSSSLCSSGMHRSIKPGMLSPEHHPQSSHTFVRLLTDAQSAWQVHLLKETRPYLSHTHLHSPLLQVFSLNFGTSVRKISMKLNFFLFTFFQTPCIKNITSLLQSVCSLFKVILNFRNTSCRQHHNLSC